MARVIDTSKPLSKKDVEYLTATRPLEYVNHMIELAGGVVGDPKPKAEPEPEKEPEKDPEKEEDLLGKEPEKDAPASTKK